MKSKSAFESFKLGRQVKSYNGQKWRSVCNEVMMTGNIMKFQQNPHLKMKLLQTGTCHIVESCIRDTYWASGFTLHDPRNQQIGLYRGKNILGIILMQLREDIRSQEGSLVVPITPTLKDKDISKEDHC
jgi:ribA/ribD-fused uncharacterized protein